MHNPLERFYNYLAKVVDRKAAKMDAKSKEREERLLLLYPEGISYDDDLEVKNPYRFL